MSEGHATRRFGCPSCGGGLKYDIASGQMICDHCGGLTPMKNLPPDEAEDTMEVTEYHCPQCGAAIYSTDTEATSFCSFCGSDVVLTGRLTRTRRPAWIVPFTVTREDCEAAYRKHLKKYRMAPAALKQAETISHFRPVYVPFWSYRVEAEGVAELVGTKSYTRGDTRYDETYELTLNSEIRQEGILYDASSAFEDETAALLRYTNQDTKQFYPAYLSGFYAQAADVPGETYHAEAAASAVRLYMDQVKQEYGLDAVEMKGDINDNFGLPNARYGEELVMMPVWLLAHRQGDRVVYTAVNGHSGEVVCDMPVSTGRTAGTTVVLAALIFLLLNQFLTVKANLMMAMCAVISLVTQYQFSGAQTRLFARRTRANEPDLKDPGKEFTGPAQSMLKRKNGRVSSGGSASFGAKMVGTVGLIVAVFIVFGVLTSMPNLELLRTSGARDNLAKIVMGGVLVIMLIHLARHLTRADRGPVWPRLLSLLACGAGCFCLLTGRVDDYLYYICAAAILVCTCVELVMVNQAHNEYASRPVPYFNGEEGDEA